MPQFCLHPDLTGSIKGESLREVRSSTGLCFCLMVLVCLASARLAIADESNQVPDDIQQRYQARDTLQPREDDRPDANVCLSGLCWPAGEFEVVRRPPQSRHGDYLVQFPSPFPSGNPQNDQVCLEWFAVKNEQGELQRAPAIVVVHESGSSMPVGRIFATNLREKGFHAFMIQLPYYGLRRSHDRSRDEANQIGAMRQGVADVRRARDAVAAIPEVDARVIGLQGTSLGGFVSSTAASLDARYDAVFLMLSGGDLYDIIQNGARDAAKVRERLEQHGISGDTLKELVSTVEPTRIAHRLDPQRVWLYSGLFDNVVPQRNSLLLAAAIGLPEDHHIRMPADHYTGVAFLPMVFAHIQQQMQLLQLSEAEAD